MTTNPRALSSLGMAMRAGKLVTGDETVLKAVRGGKVKMVIMAADASENTKKKYRDKCSTYGITLTEAFDRASLGAAIGKEERVLVGVADAGFASLIRKQLSHPMEVENID